MTIVDTLLSRLSFSKTYYRRWRMPQFNVTKDHNHIQAVCSRNLTQFVVAAVQNMTTLQRLLYNLGSIKISE